MNRARKWLRRDATHHDFAHSRKEHLLMNLARKWLRRDVIKLTMPILMEQTFLMSLGVVNTIMASRIGQEAVSAIGMVDSIHFIFIAFFSALAVGGTVVVAQLTGLGRTGQANDAAKQALFSGLVLSILITAALWFGKHLLIQSIYSTAEPAVLRNAFLYFNITVLTYPLICISTIANGVLRGAGDTRTPMKINIIINVINLVLSYTLIYGLNFGGGDPGGSGIAFGHADGAGAGVAGGIIIGSSTGIHIPGMGVKGAAIAISIARSLGAIFVLIVLVRGTKQMRLEGLGRFKLNVSLQKSIFGIGIPASVESLMFNGGKLITQVFIVGMGTISIASNYIAGSMNSLLLIPGNALCIAATTMVGQAMGRRDTAEAASLMKYMVWLAVAAQVVMGLTTYPITPAIASLYSREPKIIELASLLFRMSLIMSPIAWSWSFLLPSGLKGAGDVKFTMITSVIGMWTFRIVLGYLFAIPMKLGVVGIWLGMYTDWIVRGILYGLRLKGGRWKSMTVLKDEEAKPKITSIEM
jgi:Na+-driven multidrug efflux pump